MVIKDYAEDFAMACEYSYHCDVYTHDPTQGEIVRFWIRLDGDKFGRETRVEYNDNAGDATQKVRDLGDVLDQEISNDNAPIVLEGSEFPRI